MRIDLPWQRLRRQMTAEADAGAAAASAAPTFKAASPQHPQTSLRARFGFGARKAMASSRATPAPAIAGIPASAADRDQDYDLRALGRALNRQKLWIIVPTLAALIGSAVVVNMLTPRYKSEARVFVEPRDNIFLRPNVERQDSGGGQDPEFITSQVQVVLSRDLARTIIAENKLAELPEFNPALRSSRFGALLSLLGLGSSRARNTEELVLLSYYDRLTVYPVEKSRVIVIEFQSNDALLSAKVADSIAENYLLLQQKAKQAQARAAGQWLSGEIETLRKRVADAEARVEEFRSKSDLFTGTNNTTLSSQQLGELQSQLNNARATKADAESKAKTLRDMLQSGRPIEASDVLNTDVIRRLNEQRTTARANLAEQSSTLLDAHPRIKELRAQIADYERQIRDEVARMVRILENDARISGARVESLSTSLDKLKKEASSTNSSDVELRALEREAKAQRDLLEAYLARYREATTRESIGLAPADARIISRAVVSTIPSFPRKMPIIIIATALTFLVSTGLVVTIELFRAAAPSRGTPARQVEAAAFARPRAPNETPSMVPELQQPMPSLQGDIAALARVVRGDAGGPKLITMLTMAAGDDAAATALALGRDLARAGRAIVVGRAGAEAVLEVAALDRNGATLSDLDQGTASFGDVIGRDRDSELHLLRMGPSKSGVTSPHLTMVLQALALVYDYVIIDAGMVSAPAGGARAPAQRAVVLPDAPLSDAERQGVASQLLGSGFAAVTILDASEAVGSRAAVVPQPRAIPA